MQNFRAAIPSSKPPDVFVFDVCDTLYYSNTTFDFLRFVLAERGSTGQRTFLRALTMRWSPLFWALAAWQRLAGGDSVKGAALQLLSTIPKAELYALGSRFVAEFLPVRRIDYTHELLAGLTGSQTRIFLLSASLDPVISALATALGHVEFASSQLEYAADGRCTGRLAYDLTGQKQLALREALGDEAQDSLVMAVATDNFTDYELVAQADVRHVIVHSAANKNFWQKLNPHFIEAYH